MDITNSYKNSHADLGTIYFWTATINSWYHLLLDDSMKDIIIESLQFLKNKKLITIYGFVIMPNHIHLIWKLNEMNGKESPKSSFLKFTAHQFKRILNNQEALQKYFVLKSDRKYQFWQDDALAIPLYSQKVILQKLNYIHNNPLQDRWRLCVLPENYKYSSANFYENGIGGFDLLTHINEIL